MVFECTYNLQALLVVASHNFVQHLKHTTFVIFLLVNTIVPFHDHFLLVFKLFPIHLTLFYLNFEFFLVLTSTKDI
jgi:hypothetical protein